MTDGAVRIDGHDVRQVTQESLRQNVGVVQQDVFLFAASILENIRYGKPGASEEEVARAAKLAEIYDDIVALPEGFNTYVGGRGTLLSGGQKQRISIARIFLKDPPVLILDEATSALDSVTEAKLQETFEKLAHGRTTIIIAHRLSTVRNADRIAVIEDGRITELGSHDQLMAKKWRLCGAGADAGADRPWKKSKLLDRCGAEGRTGCWPRSWTGLPRRRSAIFPPVRTFSPTAADDGRGPAASCGHPGDCLAPSGEATRGGGGTSCFFLPDWMEPETAEPPLRCLRAAFRTDDRLSHRDILGSLMGMGIVREKVGGHSGVPWRVRT